MIEIPKNYFIIKKNVYHNFDIEKIKLLIKEADK